MDTWHTTNLKQVSTNIDYGYTASAENINIGPKFLRITDIVSKRVKWENVPFCSINSIHFEKYKLISGDIVVARTGATTGVNYLIKESDPKYCIFASYLIRFRPNQNKIYPPFLGYVLSSMAWKNYIEESIGGSAQPGINAKVLEKFSFSLPPLAEQKSIAAVLSSLDDKIDLLHRQNATLERMAETLFRQWFIDEAEEDWKECCLENIVSIYRGASPRPIIKYVKNGTIPWIKIADATATSSPFIFSTNEFIIEDGIKKSFEVYPDDLILSNSATCGLPFFVAVYGCVHDGWLIFRNFKKLPKEYIFLFLRQISKNLNQIADGSVQNNLNTTLLKNYKIRIPPEYKIDLFNKHIPQYINKIKSNQQQIRTLEKLRDTLLPKLMSGEVRVRVAE